MNTIRVAADHGNSPAIMSTTTGTIAFGTTFLALAAGLAVFAAIRNNKGESLPPPSPTIPSMFEFYRTTSPKTTTARNMWFTDERAITRAPLSEFKQITTKSAPTTTTTTTFFTPPTTTLATVPRQPVVYPNTYIRQVSGRNSNNNRNRAMAGRTRRITTTTARPYNEIDIEENYFDGEPVKNDDFEVADSDLRQLLNSYYAPRRTTTPRSVISLKPRTLNPSRRLYPPGAAAPWPPAGRVSSSTAPPFEPIVLPRMTRQQNNLQTSQVLNDELPSRPSNNVRRRETTPPHKLLSPVSALPMPQVFADEPPPGYNNVGSLPSLIEEDHNATPSTPILLTLFTTAIVAENETLAAVVNNSSSTNNSTEPAPSSTPGVEMARQSHRRSVLPSTGATSSANDGINSSVLSSVSATSFLAAVALLLFVAVLLIVALFIQRRRFLAKLRQSAAIRHCRVLPLPVAIPSSSSPTAIVELADSSTPSSSNLSSSHSSPKNCNNHHHQMDASDDIIKAMKTLSNGLVDSANGTTGSVQFSTGSAYPMALHHY